ncbi:MAG: TonB family protein, partial [Polyangiaceae bacterium]
MRRTVIVWSLVAVPSVLCTGRVALAQPQSPGAASASATRPSQPDAAMPPVLRSRAEAPYPPDALRDRIEGTVGIEVVVGETGAVTDARVIVPAGHGFDEAALAAVRKFTFEPAKSNGAAIRSTVQLSYEFRLPPPTPPAPLASRAQSSPVQQGPGQTTLVLAQRPQWPIGAPPERNAASASSAGSDEFDLMPRRKTNDLLGT